jgi:ABC-type nitrate/sulfonate/bicarbonate transport system substrate-binding protein
MLLALAVIIVLVAGSQAWAAERTAKLTPVRIAVVSRGTLDLPFWVARERGFFRDEGIDAEIILFKASRRCKRCSAAASISAPPPARR